MFWSFGFNDRQENHFKNFKLFFSIDKLTFVSIFARQQNDLIYEHLIQQFAMFNTTKNRTQEVAVTPAATSSATLNMIAAGTIIEGEIKSSGDLRIDGTVKGSVLSKAKVVVGTTGLIEGDVFAQNADISGSVRGKTTVSETTFLKNSAKVHGDIITSKLVVEVGASFTGNCNMGATVKELNIGDKPAEKQQLKEKTA